MQILPFNGSWFTGVVEDRHDPLKQGRVRVRVAGVHPFSRIQGDVEGMPIEDLPWMSVVLPVTSAGMSGNSGSITGLVEGSHVFGQWLDKYKINGIVQGTTTGNMVNTPNFDEGFSDPSGQYPSRLGTDSSSLSLGGDMGADNDANIYQDENLDEGINPGAPGQSNPDSNPNYTMERMLKKDEGVRNTLYWDHLGFPTIGIGHLIVPQKTKNISTINNQLSKDLGRSVSGNRPSITHTEITTLFEKDLKQIQSEIKKNRTIAPVYNKCNRSRQMALENMAFQLGTGGLAKFKTMLKFMFAENWVEAAKSGKRSKWARQTPGRASRICRIILNGNLTSYGVPVSTKSASKTFFVSNGFSAFASSDDDDLSQPFVEDNNLQLFAEPESSYKGEYPYVHAYQSESGLVQEFDDTPGQERFRVRHPTGSYNEYAPDGRTTTKSVGDSYQLTNGNHNLLVQGDNKVNIGGNETVYNMGSLNQTVDGDIVKIVHGNTTVTIDGDNNVSIKGSTTITVEGDANVTVQGNAGVNVQGNYDLTVQGNMNWNITGTVTQNISGAWTQSCPSLTVDVAGSYSATATRYDFK